MVNGKHTKPAICGGRGLWRNSFPSCYAPDRRGKQGFDRARGCGLGRNVRAKFITPPPARDYSEFPLERPATAWEAEADAAFDAIFPGMRA
jgi:hypothetical protein